MGNQRSTALTNFLTKRSVRHGFDYVGPFNELDEMWNTGMISESDYDNALDMLLFVARGEM